MTEKLIWPVLHRNCPTLGQKAFFSRESAFRKYEKWLEETDRTDWQGQTKRQTDKSPPKQQPKKA